MIVHSVQSWAAVVDQCLVAQLCSISVCLRLPLTRHTDTHRVVAEMSTTTQQQYSEDQCDPSTLSLTLLLIKNDWINHNNSWWLGVQIRAEMLVLWWFQQQAWLVISRCVRWCCCCCCCWLHNTTAPDSAWTQWNHSWLQTTGCFHPSCGLEQPSLVLVTTC